MISKGFSLIELLIVITLVGICAMFAYPSYHNSIIQGRRLDGKTALLELANRMEQYYSAQRTYQGATLGTGNITDILSTTHSEQNWYTLAIMEQTETHFSLHAIPIQAQATEDTLCQTLTFNSQGLKGITSGPHGIPQGSSSQCW